MITDYTAGAVSIEAGSRALYGVGVTWLTAGFRPGDTLYLKGFAMPLASVDGETSATLYDDWPGETVAAAEYRLRFQPDISRMSAKAQAIIDGLADAKGDPGAPGANFDPDAIGDFADRESFDEEAEGFSFLSLDGDGDAIETAVLFIRAGAPGEWSAPIPFQGPEGPPGEIADLDPYTHTQASPSDAWTVNHNLGRHPAAIAVYVGGALVDAAVAIVSLNTISVSFSTPRSGVVEVI